MTSSQKWFLHVDLDAFFAAVEQLDFPQYRGKPIIVGGKPGERRGVVSTASYEARKYGVHSAMTIANAYKLCPEGIFLHGRMERYLELSYKIMKILKDYSPDVEQMSIDEAFIDLTGTENLFGDPKETAFKIKKRIKDEIGLTISAGLASSKYLAKIASDINKPDGFYYVEHGKEEEFMLSLPLKKVFGIGKKSLENLQKNGFYTTKDIYEKELITLEFLFGKNTANFLYNVVRGNESGNFDKETKSHSISNEITFPYDLTDIYTIETKILELCQQVLFRLMKEKSYSQTVFVKIRYEDFTTVSIQKTLNNTILTLDSFFIIAKELFEEKYDKNKGIRLIGIALKNIEKEKPSYQGQLFEEDNFEKKKKVEEAIFNLSNKHPDIKIHKARILEDSSKKIKALFIFLLLSLSFFNKNPNKLYAEEKNNNFIPIFKWEVSENNNIDFLFSGYWKTSFTSALSSYFGYKNPFSLDFTMPIFKNEIELSGKAQLNKNWYFQIDFFEDFNDNSYTLAYQNSKYLQEFRISNRGIFFPQYYSSEKGPASLGGGNNISPGISLHFNDYKNNKWQGDFIFKYDFSKSNSAIFYGKNAVSDLTAEPGDFLIGKEFIIPMGEKLLEISDIYIESENGSYKDIHNKTYKKIPKSDYSLIPSQNMLIFSNNLQTKENEKVPTILISFQDEEVVTNLEYYLGDYNMPESFLGQIQSFFNKSNLTNNKINLEDYSISLTNSIENTKLLQIQASNGFSPFACNNLYDFGIITQGDFKVISESTDKTSNEYTAILYDNNINFTQNDFFTKNHLYSIVQNQNYPNCDYTNPAYRYPFADTNPLLYLTKEDNSDLNIIARTYSPVSNYYIGNQVAGQSVKVYINGIQDYSAKYDSSNGNVIISKNVNELDKIYISWQESSNNLSNGALLSALGFQYLFSPDFKIDTAFTARLPFSPQIKYAQYLENYTGFAALSAGLDYKNGNFSINDNITLSLENTNTTGIYLADSQVIQSNESYYLGINMGFPTKIAPYINIKNQEIQLLESNNASVKNHLGLSDKEISGYAIPLNYDFSEFYQGDLSPNPDENLIWAAVDVELPMGKVFHKADSLELAIKAQNLSQDCKIYLQLGIKADKNPEGEEKNKIPTWCITSPLGQVIQSLNTNDNNWQIVKIAISNSDKAKLISNYDLRLIITKEKSLVNENEKGSILIGPYEADFPDTNIHASDKIFVKSRSFYDQDSPSAKKYMKQDNFATEITWEYIQDPIDKEDLEIISANYFNECNFSQYKNIKLDFSYNNLEEKTFTSPIISSTSTSPFILILDNNTESLFENNNPALYLEIYDFNQVKSFLENDENNIINWHTLSINLDKNEVLIDNKILEKNQYKLIINENIEVSKKIIKISSKIDDERFINKGKFIIGNLYFENTQSNLQAFNNINAEYSYPKEIISWNNFEILGHANFALNSKQNIIFNNEKKSEKNINADITSSINLLGLQIEGQVSSTASSSQKNNAFIESANHSIISKEYFNVIKFTETFSNINSESLIQKGNEIKLDFSKVFIPLVFSIKNQSYKDIYNQNKKSNANLNFTLKNKLSTIKFNSDFILEEKINIYGINNFNYSTDNSSIINYSNYFNNYVDIFKYQFNFGSNEAFYRNNEINSKLSVSTFSDKFIPSISYIIKGQYSNSSSMNYSDKEELTISLPFAIKNNIFSLSHSKIAGGNNNSPKGGNYKNDLEKLFELQKNRDYLYKSIPFYDLFQSDLNKLLFEKNDITNFYSSQYDFIWKRQLYNNYKDLFLPSSFQLQVSRDIQRSGIFNDIYQFKAIINHSAMNIFGLNSKLKKFKWYNHDEFSNNINLIVKLPNNSSEKATFTFSSNSSLWFIITSENNLQGLLNISIDNDKNWSSSASLLWNHKGENSIINEIIKFFSENIVSKKNLISRQEILSLTINNDENTNYQLIEYIHNLNIAFSQHTNLLAAIGASLSHREDSYINLGINLSIGMNMEF